MDLSGFYYEIYSSKQNSSVYKRLSDSLALVGDIVSSSVGSSNSTQFWQLGFKIWNPPFIAGYFHRVKIKAFHVIHDSKRSDYSLAPITLQTQVFIFL